MTNLSAETALLNALRIENASETKYFLMEAVNLGTTTEPNWYHLGTSGCWDTQEEVQDIIAQVQETRPNSVYSIMCEVTSSQTAQAIVL